MTNQNLMGYPPIDKPWLKYYSEKAVLKNSTLIAEERIAKEGERVSAAEQR